MASQTLFFLPSVKVFNQSVLQVKLFVYRVLKFPIKAYCKSNPLSFLRRFSSFWSEYITCQTGVFSGRPSSCFLPLLSQANTSFAAKQWQRVETSCRYYLKGKDRKTTGKWDFLKCWHICFICIWENTTFMLFWILNWLNWFIKNTLWCIQ